MSLKCRGSFTGAGLEWSVDGIDWDRHSSDKSEKHPRVISPAGPPLHHGNYDGNVRGGTREPRRLPFELLSPLTLFRVSFHASAVRNGDADVPLNPWEQCEKSGANGGV